MRQLAAGVVLGLLLTGPWAEAAVKLPKARQAVIGKKVMAPDLHFYLKGTRYTEASWGSGLPRILKATPVHIHPYVLRLIGF
jgi:hypothetical protein